MKKSREEQRKEGELAAWPLQQSCGHKHFPELVGPVANEADSVTGSEETMADPACWAWVKLREGVSISEPGIGRT